MVIPSNIIERAKNIEKELFNSQTPFCFKEIALELFAIQSKYCAPYANYIELLGVEPHRVTKLEQIPFLPISLFKNFEVKWFQEAPQAIFKSSTTTGATPSKHFVKSLDLYKESFLRSFELFHGSPSNYVILALLPSYLEREGSSLVYMAQELISLTNNKESGFYLYNHKELFDKLVQLQKQNQKTILLGVTFALLDFAHQYNVKFPSLKVVETGGMKGRKEELPREEIHQLLKEAFGVESIGSEYGMAELMSQSWSYGQGLFFSPPWKRVLIRDLSNPFKELSFSRVGGVNIIDLANIYTCSFIETQDMGIKEADNSFRITGRIENSELRGCNLLLEP